MPQTRLFPSRRCPGYFGVMRFDRRREGGATRKVHMASAAALLETSHRIPNLSYEILMRLVRRVCGTPDDLEALFRLMCLNVLAGNHDDHAKNFSFLYDEDEGCWHLSPAYDLTRCPGPYGERATTVNGKGRGIRREDCLAVAREAGIPTRRARQTFDEVREALAADGLLDPEYR